MRSEQLVADLQTLLVPASRGDRFNLRKASWLMAWILTHSHAHSGLTLIHLFVVEFVAYVNILKYPPSSE